MEDIYRPCVGLSASSTSTEGVFCRPCAGMRGSNRTQRCRGTGPQKSWQRCLVGLKATSQVEGKSEENPANILAGVKSTLQVREPGPRGLFCSQCACMQGMPASLVGCSRPPCWPGFERRPPRVIKTRTRHGKDFSDPPMGFFSSFSGMFSLCPRACPRFLALVAAVRICASHASNSRACTLPSPSRPAGRLRKLRMAQEEALAESNAGQGKAHPTLTLTRTLGLVSLRSLTADWSSETA